MENGPGLKMNFPSKVDIFHCYVTLPEGTRWPLLVIIGVIIPIDGLIDG